MNFDTAPIAEVEAWLIERFPRDHPSIGWTFEPSQCILNTMDAAIACLPPGWYWGCEAGAWNAWPERGPIRGMTVSTERSREPILAHDELLRLAAKAWAKMEEAR